MGHNVNYKGSLKLVRPLTAEQRKFFEKCQDDYDYLYALNYENGSFAYTYNEKIYTDVFYKTIVKFAKKLKEMGNDFEDKCYLFACSEEDIDEECRLLIYIKGEFKEISVDIMLKEFINTL